MRQINDSRLNATDGSNDSREESGGRYGEIELMKHQIEGVERLGSSELVARLIGDEMRVGKTPTAIGIDYRLRSELTRQKRGNNCTLVVCPKSVINHWAELAARMGIPSSEIFTIDLPHKSTLEALLGEISKSKKAAKATPYWVIINWDAVQTIRKELVGAGPWFHIIGDEIHRIKGRKTKRTESFKKLKTKQKTGLSGTPADNKPEDFWSILNWLLPSEYGSYWNFVNWVCDVKVNRKSGYSYIDGVNPKALPEFREKIAPFYIRRMLVDVADHIPQKQYRTVYVEMGKKQRREYEELKQENMADIAGGLMLTPERMTLLVRLQQMAIGCCSGEWIKRRERNKDTGELEWQDYFDVHITDEPKSPKIDAVMDLIDDEETEAGPFCIFAQHKDTCNIIKDRIERKGKTCEVITGLNSADERSGAIRRFQSRQSHYIVGTIGACREGITLSEANTIIRVDRAWNSSHNKQLEARADSLTGDKPVTIIDIETRNSIDQDRRLKIHKKGEDVDAITST